MFFKKQDNKRPAYAGLNLSAVITAKGAKYEL